MKHQLLLALSLLAPAIACGGAEPSPIDNNDPMDPNDPSDPNDPNDPSDPSDPNDPSDPAPEAIALDGNWAMKTMIGQLLTSPLGDGAASVSTYALVRATVSGTRVSMTAETCAIDMTPFQGATTTYPEATLRAMSGSTIEANVSALEVGATFNVPTHPRLLGWNASRDPMTEAIPSEEDDARVADVDGDGHPGATISVASSFATGDVYIVSRQIQSFAGNIVSKDRIEGRSTTNMEQEILGATELLLTFDGVTSMPDPNPATNTFTLVRLGANAACAQVQGAF